MSIHDPILRMKIKLAALLETHHEYVEVMMKGMQTSPQIAKLLEEMRVPTDREHGIGLLYLAVVRLIANGVDAETMAGPMMTAIINIVHHRMEEVNAEILQDIKDGKPCQGCGEIHDYEEVKREVAAEEEVKREVAAEENKRMADELMDLLERSKPSGRPC